MLAVTAILSCVIKIRRIFKSTKWRHFENVKFEALSARHGRVNVLYHLLAKIGKEPNADLFPFMKGASHQRTEEEIKFVF